MFRANKDLKDFKIKSPFSNWISPKNVVDLDYVIGLIILYLIFCAMA